MSEYAVQSHLLVGGICLYAGGSHLFLSLWRRKAVHALFGLLCLLAFGYALGETRLYQSSGISAYISILRQLVTLGVLWNILFVWFVGYYAALRPIRFLLAHNTLCLSVLLINTYLPDTLMLSEVDRVVPRTLPWGEQVQSVEGVTSPWAVLIYLPPLVSLGFAYVCCYRLFVLKKRSPARFLTIATSLQLSALLVTGLIDFAGLQFIHVEEFSFVSFILLMTFSLVFDVETSEKAVRASERRFRQMAKTIQEVFYLIDLKTGDLLYVSPGCRKLCGYSASEWKAKQLTWLEAVLPDERAEVQAGFDNLYRGKPFEAEYQIQHQDESIRWISNKAIPITDREGNVVRAAGVMRDITEHKQADEALRQQNELNENIVNTARLIILVLDGEGKILQFNPYFEELTGWRLDEVRGHDWFNSFLPERDRSSIRQVFSQSTQGDQVRGNVNPILSKDGREHEIEWYDAPLTNSEGEIIGLLCTGLDITDRKKAELELIDREMRLRSILQTATDAIITIDRNGIIIALNPATEKLFGYMRDELVGQNVKILMPPPYCDEHGEYLRHYLETSEARIIGVGREVEGRRKDGTVFPIDLAVSEIEHLGLFTGIIRDITERKAEQERLLQATRLAALGQAMTSLTHESRNALARSQANLRRLTRRVKDNVEQMELIEGIRRALDDIHQQFEEIRDYAAPIQLRLEAVELSDVILDAWKELDERQKGREARLRFHHQEQNVVCEIDSYSLRHAFRNIFENALAACADPVVIDISFAQTTRDERPVTRISICDNGPGMSPETRQRAFDAFYTTKTCGTGLGLSIVKRTIDAHGGEVGFGGSDGGGTEIIITLPRPQE